MTNFTEDDRAAEDAAIDRWARKRTFNTPQELDEELARREVVERNRRAISIELAGDGIAAHLSPDARGQIGFYPDDNPKTAVGASKPSTNAIPPIAILHLGKAMANGVAKYGKLNWRTNAVTTSVYTDAIERHMLAYRDGEDLAADSGAHHLAHVMACCAILLDAEACGKLRDDRGPKGNAAAVIDSWSKQT